MMCDNDEFFMKKIVYTTLQQQQTIVEQLRREASIKRLPLSVVIDDIKQYILHHQHEDCLIVGFSSQKANPFREKSVCEIL
ncbi:Guanine nucleotide-binding protein subunit gamma-1 [Armadillidium nasatum]|uniref:Guanine nucleotide-binding protein subunit gamma-1 n=1 Tax=Armadillidium nasatum TaxID=96803 RepID=A0A5N5SLT1_9CRUS|nr:Guanine nucleotide-binding protein subunit gamma-1 [Armadillidium nasatum]